MDVSLQSRRDHNHMRDGGGGAVPRPPLGLPERSDSMQKRFPNHASLFAAAHAHALQWLQAQVQWRAAGLLLVGLLVVPFVLADVCSRSSSDCFSLVAGRSSLTVLDYWQQPQQMTEEQVLLQRTLEEKERRKDEQGDADGGREAEAAAAVIAVARPVGATTGGGGEGKVGAATVQKSRAASVAALQGGGEKPDDYVGADVDADSDAAVAAAAAAAASLAKEDAEAAAAATADDVAATPARAKLRVRVEGSRRAALTSAAVSSSALGVDAGSDSGGVKQRTARRSRSTSDAGSSSPGTREEVTQEEKRGVSGQVGVGQKEAVEVAVETTSASAEVVLTATALPSDRARAAEGRRRRRRKAGAAAAAAAAVAVELPDADRAMTSDDAVAARSELSTPGDGAVDAAGAKRIKIAASSTGRRRSGRGRRHQRQHRSSVSEVAESEKTEGAGEKESLRRRRRSSKRRRALEGAPLNPKEQETSLIPEGQLIRTVSANTSAAAQGEEGSIGQSTLWRKLCGTASSVPALALLLQAVC